MRWGREKEMMTERRRDNEKGKRLKKRKWRRGDEEEGECRERGEGRCTLTLTTQEPKS
jgi:hypothetical protein